MYLIFTGTEGEFWANSVEVYVVVIADSVRDAVEDMYLI